jgi:hypothetical protein
VHGQHQVRLLDHLLAVEVEVQQQRVALRRRGREVPLGVLGEPLRLRVHVEHVVVGDDQLLGRLLPGAHLLGGDPESLGHQVGVDVVVHHRGVLVRPGHPVDPEPAVHTASL